MKRLIICCDGTWNSADQEHDGIPVATNVIKLAYRIAKRDGAIPQVVFYDQGVGTGNVLDRTTGGAFGAGLEDNILDAYRFLIANYEKGDELFFFGFSRGAFTARSLSGMVRNCGILRRESIRQYKDAINLYMSPSPDHHPDAEASIAFKEAHSVCGSEDIAVAFIGVWDTVGARGIPMRGLRWLTSQKYGFHDTELSGTVRHAYHALAIDERRAPFEPTLWDCKPKPRQSVEQVWFCGVHSDVGGGYLEHGLSDLPLHWMMEKAAGVGLVFDQDLMNAHKLSSDPLAILHNSKTGLYRLTPGIDRPIGLRKEPAATGNGGFLDDPTQRLHESVRLRWDNDQEYRPSALREYFVRTGDSRGAQS